MHAINLFQQTTDPILTFFSSYGWMAALGYILIKEIIPFLREHFSAEHKRILAREEAEREARVERENRMMVVLDQFGQQLHTFGLAMTAVAERLSSIERDQDGMRSALAILADRKQRE